MTLAQQSRDLALITNNKGILGLGFINSTSCLVLDKKFSKSEIDTLVPMEEGGLKVAKALALRDLVQIQCIINKGILTTEEGLAPITKIKMSMNKLKN